ncbi:sensor histidine kinase [Nonomuraea aurantiaca]|uniref:sensor histidine kinase n=1 Tax=Nonomuraea aurantiaca TaxID=2878562 RepID=UPI001CD99F1C|nr:histidine kinase [Nonomuraea aurantiaca]MCA2223742.1 histidine kinase [Nonomuraea aurantiaca]
MRWRGVPLDLVLAAAGTALDVLLSAKGGGSALLPGNEVIPMAVGVGAPMGLVRRAPLAVSLYLAAFLVFTDQVESFTSNTAQMLLCVSIGLVAYRSGRRQTCLALGVAIAATAVNLADPGIAFTTNAWMYSVLVPALPVLIGAYLRGPAGRLKDADLTPDVLLAGGGVAFTVLSTWTDWHSGTQPVWVVGLLAVLGGLSLGVARRFPGLVFMFQSALLIAADQYLNDTVTTCLILTLIALCVFAMRIASWAWITVTYVTCTMLASIAIVQDSTEVTAFRVAVLMALVTTPVAIGRYLGVRQAAAEAEGLRLRESARLAVAQVRADQLLERENIAREVHDIVAHHVGAMVLRAGAARYAAPEGPVADALADIRETGHQALEDLRGLLDVLRDPGRRPDMAADPAAVIRESAERMTAAGLQVELELDPATAHAPLVARASAARIVQEGLTNVLKHAGPGTQVSVAVTSAGQGLTVHIRNGSPPTTIERLPSSGRGLAGMRERVRALGGTLSAGLDQEGGWLLTANIPAAPHTTEPPAAPHTTEPPASEPVGERTGCVTDRFLARDLMGGDA